MQNLSAVALLQFVTNSLYLVVFVTAGIAAFRRPIRANIDVALLFGVTALIIGITWVSQSLGAQPSQAVIAFSSALVMSLPYLFLRLVDDFTGLPSRVLRLAEAGLLLSVVGLFAFIAPYPLPFTLALVVYFTILEIGGARKVVQAAGRARGVTRRRLHAVAIGSLFLGIMILTAGLQAAFPSVQTIWAMLVQFLAFASGIAYVVGFAPPVWIRQAWQSPELRTSLRESAGLIRLPDRASVVRELERSCEEALSATRASIGLADFPAMVIRFQIDNQMVALPLEKGMCGTVLLTLKPNLTDDPAGDDPDFASAFPFQSALVAPIVAGKRRIGVVVAGAARSTIFAEDDLELLRVLADHIAVILENRNLVEQTANERARSEALALAEAERRQVNVELEARIAERTIELQNVIEELEAFSYSVSHDLRSPLSTIDGFVQAFLDDYGDRLDDIGRDYLRRTRMASQRMGLLIDGLLRLSRVTRADMVRQPVDLSGLARSVAADLHRSRPDRDVIVTVEDGLKVDGDDQLLRIALENLFGNAWKFSMKRSHARISFQSRVVDGVRVYEIADNGVGFDMTYADKLFGPFQRLHGRDEFEGTGIGLATVQRIVRRHGGRIWAEATVDRGAKISFTLEPEQVDREGGKADDTIEQTRQQSGDLAGRR